MLVARGGALTVPSALWGTPGRIRLFCREGEWSAAPVRLIDYAKAAARRVLRRPDRSIWYRRATTENGAAEYVQSSVGTPPSGRYHIVNYGGSVALLPADTKGETEGRQAAWAGYSGYHEHLPFAEQDSSATRVSRWLARTLLPYRPSSVLELGCGSGRNLYWIARTIPHAQTLGVEINPEAVRESVRQGVVGVRVGSLYDTHLVGTKSIDVALTSGVLMHVPAENVERVVREMHRIARVAVVHFELHGPSNPFDFHRYPRDYRALYERLDLPVSSYRVFPRWDYRSRGTNSFRHALLVSAC